VILRLPGSVKQVFEDRLRQGLPLSAAKVLARTREMRNGKLNDPRFGTRMTGEGTYAEAIAQLFEQTARKLGLSGDDAMRRRDETATTFERPAAFLKQLRLF
jgi:DNA repair photolyase